MQAFHRSFGCIRFAIGSHSLANDERFLVFSNVSFLIFFADIVMKQRQNYCVGKIILLRSDVLTSRIDCVFLFCVVLQAVFGMWSFVLMM